MNLSGFHPEARAEFLAAVAYYTERDTDLAAGFILEVERGANLARTEPQSGNPVAPGVRRIILRRFPYAVLFRGSAGVEVIAVAHHRRRPGYWMRRIA